MLESLFDKVVVFGGPATLSKKNPTQVLSCERTYFGEHL